MKKDKTEEKLSLKTCAINPSHVWMADIAYCPYCVFIPQQRIDWMRNERKEKK